MTMADALASAQAEIGEVTPVDSEAGIPPVDEQAVGADEQVTPSSGEQPATDEGGFDDAATELAASLLDTDEESQNGSGSGIVPGSDDFWNQSVDVPTAGGPENLTVRELADGYLRQADYTRKTQEVAGQRKTLERAEEFLKAFEANPFEFTRSLSVQAGLITEGDTPVQQIDIAKIPSQEEIDAMIDERTEERISTDPRVKDAEIAAARAQVNTEFDRLQDVFGIPLNPELRESLIEEASRTQTGDLEGLLAKRIYLRQQKEARAGRQSQAATSRPGTPPQGATTPEGDKPKEKPTMAEAFKMAQVTAAQQ